MTDKETGVLISKIRPLTHASEVLKKHDVILSIDGQVVGNDGTVPFRNQERISFDWVLSQKHSGESVALGVLREG
jgi:S1-C subfamily serine protease